MYESYEMCVPVFNGGSLGDFTIYYENDLTENITGLERFELLVKKRIWVSVIYRFTSFKTRKFMILLLALNMNNT